MEVVVEFKQVTRSYGSKLAVDCLDMALKRGELFALLGHNGAGKTTTIKMLVGLLMPNSGTVTVGGYDIASQPREAVGLVGYVPDQPYLYDKLTGREFLQFVADMYGYAPALARDRLDREIERFGLGPFINELTETYSHGMKQRTVFAAAMLHDPEVLVVDEPLVGLDPHSIRLVIDLLKSEVDRGLCVLMSTHTLEVAEKIADRVGIMKSSRLLFSGRVSELRSLHADESLSLEALYMRLMDHAAADSSTPDTAGS